MDKKDLTKSKIVKDITVRAKISDYFKEAAMASLPYEVQDGERPEQLAFRIYDRSDLHWLILLFNEVHDPSFEWPLSSAEMESMMASKYGGYAIYYPDKVGSIEQGYTSLAGAKTIEQRLKNGKMISANIIKWNPTYNYIVVDGENASLFDSDTITKGQNLLTHSNDVTKWGASTTLYEIISDYSMGPNTEQEADLVVKISNTTSTLSRTVVWNRPGNAATFSIYFKKPVFDDSFLVGKNNIDFRFRNETKQYNYTTVSFGFNDANQQFSGGDEESESFWSITQAEDNWYRLSITVNSETLERGDTLRLYYGDIGVTSGSRKWILYESLLLWGMQLEEGLSASPLTATEGYVIEGYENPSDSYGRFFIDGKQSNSIAFSRIQPYQYAIHHFEDNDGNTLDPRKGPPSDPTNDSSVLNRYVTETNFIEILAIDNRTEEYKLNDKKRLIRVVKPEFLSAIVTQFRSLFT